MSSSAISPYRIDMEIFLALHPAKYSSPIYKSSLHSFESPVIMSESEKLNWKSLPRWIVFDLNETKAS